VAPQAETPVAWRAYVSEITGEVAPAQMTDGREPRWAPFDDGYDLADPVDQAIAQTRAAVFPAHEVDV
jgi:acetoin utilization protein AcuC